MINITVTQLSNALKWGNEVWKRNSELLYTYFLCVTAEYVYLHILAVPVGTLTTSNKL